MSIYGDLPKGSIVTGANALSLHGLISYSPRFVTLEMKQGTKTTADTYKDYKITTQSISTLNLSTTTIDGIKVYSLERLFIEFDKFPLEQTIKDEGYKNLLNRINPTVVSKLFPKLKSRRGIDSQRVNEFLSKYLLNVHEDIKGFTAPEIKDYLREYVMAMTSKLNVPFLVKGGSGVELFTDINRSTLDIDAHSGFGDNQAIMKELSNKNNSVYFVLSDEDTEELSTTKLNKKVRLIAKSRSTLLTEKISGLYVPISFNNTYSSVELKKIISDYKLTKMKLKKIDNYSSYVFSKEMLLAEKFQSIISKPQNSKRSKDLIDITLLGLDFNQAKFKKWLFRKWESQRDSKSKEQAVAIINSNKDLELTKIKAGFDHSVGMYGVQITYEQAINNYKELIKAALWKN